MVTSQRFIAGLALCLCSATANRAVIAERPMVRGVRHASAYQTSSGGVHQAAVHQTYSSATVAPGYGGQVVSPYGGYPAAHYGGPYACAGSCTDRPYPHHDAACFLCRPRPEIYRPGWEPTHQHFSVYHDPHNACVGGGSGHHGGGGAGARGLVYPPSEVPAAAVQYPYYTLKGPDDFFLK